jgi:hypothetical protein
VGTLARAGLTLGLLLCWTVASRPALAQYTRDRSAQEKIKQALVEQYLDRNFGQAEEVLLGVIQACEDKCRPATLARAWMYVGIVRGSGNEDQHAAREAFETALGHDAAVELDLALATPETARTFEHTRDTRPKSGKVVPLLAEPRPGNSAPAGAVATSPANSSGAGLSCTPGVREVQTLRPIPFECRADSEATRMTLRYQEHGGADWQSIELKQAGDRFRAELPCEVTRNSGTLRVFVVATDAAGDPVDTLGSKNQPLQFAVDPQTRATPPAYPGEPAPPRCEERVLCPPDFPGCEDPGASSDNAAASGSTARRQTHWLGIHFAFDVGFIGGTEVCATQNQDFDCFAAGGEAPYPAALPAGVGDPGELGDVYPGTGIGTGAAGGSLRALLSYDYVFSERVSTGLRLGYAFGGGPETLDGRGFLPVHAEGRVSYWLRGSQARGWRPYLHLGGGIAQVDLKKSDLVVRDCSEEASRPAFFDCIQANGQYDPVNEPELPEKRLDVYRKLGNAFLTGGGGVLLPLGAHAGLQMSLNALLMLPSVGFVLQPSLGLVYAL